MGLFGKKKQEETLAENEFKFKFDLRKYIVEDKSLKIQFLTKKGKLLSEENLSLSRLQSISHTAAGGSRYHILLHMADEKKPGANRTIRYDSKTEQEQADRFLEMLNERIG